MEKAPLVIDIGVSYCKVGFSGESSPRRIIPTPQRLSHRLGQSQAPHHQQETTDAQGGLRQQTTVTASWRELVLEFVGELYSRYLQCRAKERRVLVCEHILWPAGFRSALARVLLVDMSVPAMLFSPMAAHSLYATGVLTGMVVDIGVCETRAVPVFRGVPLVHCQCVVPVGAAHVSTRLLGLLRQRQPQEEALKRLSRRRGRGMRCTALEDVLVRACFVRTAVGGGEVAPVTLSVNSHDGEELEIAVSGAARSQAADALFDGDTEGDGETVTAAVLKALRGCATDVRPAVAGHVVVTGGIGGLPGLTARLAHEVRAAVGEGKEEDQQQQLPFSEFSELRAVVTRHLHVAEVRFPRQTLAWIGGSVIASLGSKFSDACVTQAAYERCGGVLPDDRFVMRHCGGADEPESGGGLEAKDGGEGFAKTPDRAAEGARARSRWSALRSVTHAVASSASRRQRERSAALRDCESEAALYMHGVPFAPK